MFLGRLFGWVLVGVAVVMASADAVMALGPADYAGLLTADVLTLLTGSEYEPASRQGMSLITVAVHAVLDLPAWLLTGGVGLLCLYGCRKKQRRYRFRMD